MTDLQEILDEFLRELLAKLAVEAKQDLRVTFFDVNDSENVVNERIEIDAAKSEAKIEIRLFRRRTERPTRFTLQAMTYDLSQDTGYSGFVAHGRLSSPNGVEITDRTNMYNVHDWESRLARVEQ